MIALYDLAPGSLRLYLIRCFRSQTLPKEVRRYRRTGLLLFLLNLPMGGIWCTMVLPVVFTLLRSRKLIAAQTSSIPQHFR